MRIIVIAAILSLGAGGAMAQTANPHASTPAIANSNSNNPGAPAKGANSFSESQAKSRIEARGFTKVSNLKKDSGGVWRGKATKDGRIRDVGLDYQGNVVAR